MRVIEKTKTKNKFTPLMKLVTVNYDIIFL